MFVVNLKKKKKKKEEKKISLVKYNFSSFYSKNLFYFQSKRERKVVDVMICSCIQFTPMLCLASKNLISSSWV